MIDEMTAAADQLRDVRDKTAKILTRLTGSASTTKTPVHIAREIFVLQMISLLADAALPNEVEHKAALEKIRGVCLRWDACNVSDEFAAAMQAERPSAIILPFPRSPR